MTMLGPVEARVRRYIQFEMFGVRGFMHPIDASSYAAILLYQREQHLSGSLAEIGVYFGRSFFLMGQTLGPGEKAFAADLFESGPLPGGDSLQLQEFRRTAQRFRIPLEPRCLVTGPSERLKPADVLDAIGLVRFFSIDGGHMIEHIRDDASLASAVLAEHGVLAFDDFCNPEWPEVSVGVFDFLRAASGEYLPFAITKAKLYICRHAFHQRYMAMLAESGWMRGYQRREITLLGSPLIWFHHRIADRILYHGLARLGLGSVAARIQSRR
jgi:hypothetical protein